MPLRPIGNAAVLGSKLRRDDCCHIYFCLRARRFFFGARAIFITIAGGFMFGLSRDYVVIGATVGAVGAFAAKYALGDVLRAKRGPPSKGWSPGSAKMR